MCINIYLLYPFYQWRRLGRWAPTSSSCWKKITSTHKECASAGSIRSPQGYSYTPGFSSLLIILFQSFLLPEKHRRASLLLLSWLTRKSLHCLISCVVGVSNSSLTVTLRLQYLNDWLLLLPYLIFVIFFTRAKLLENKIYTEKTRKLRQNTQ